MLVSWGPPRCIFSWRKFRPFWGVPGLGTLRQATNALRDLKQWAFWPNFWPFLLASCQGTGDFLGDFLGYRYSKTMQNIKHIWYIYMIYDIWYMIYDIHMIYIYIYIWYIYIYIWYIYIYMTKIWDDFKWQIRFWAVAIFLQIWHHSRL